MRSAISIGLAKRYENLTGKDEPKSDSVMALGGIAANNAWLDVTIESMRNQVPKAVLISPVPSLPSTDAMSPPCTSHIPNARGIIINTTNLTELYFLLYKITENEAAVINKV